MPIIEVSHVTKEYRLGQLQSLKQTALNGVNRVLGRPVEKRACFKALDDVSFTVEPGEVLGIIGTNGAGKSTLLKILAGITKSTRGEVKVNGSVAPLIEVGAGLVGDLTGRENIFLNGAILGLSRAEIKSKFDEIVAFAELGEFIDTPIKRYSSGMSVRLGFAIATSVAADILIVDEVLAVGDLAFQRKCFDRMEDLIKRQGRTVLLVSHNIRQIERMCSRVLMLDRGAIKMDGRANTVCNSFYENSDRLIVAQQISDKASNMSSTGEIELMDIFFVDKAGRQTRVIEYGDIATLIIKVRANKPIHNPTIFVGFHTTDFIYLTTSISPEALRASTMEQGVHHLSMTVRRFPLLPGPYATRISIDVEEPVKNVLYVDSLYHFSVVSRTLRRSSPECEGGFFSVESDWNLHPGHGYLESGSTPCLITSNVMDGINQSRVGQL